MLTDPYKEVSCQFSFELLRKNEPICLSTITQSLISHLFAIIGGVVVVGNTITEAVVLHTDRPIIVCIPLQHNNSWEPVMDTLD